MKSERPANWIPEEIERVLEALSETPKLLKGLDINAIYRMKESVNPENPAANHGGDIVIYDAAFEPKYKLAHVLDHEMAHLLFGALSEREKKAFRDAAKWGLTESKTFVPGRPEGQFLRKNGMLSPDEDFADSVTAYIHEPQKLKKVSPETFGWMERHLKPKIMTGSVK